MTYLVRQMGHVVISSPDPHAAARDLVENVGLRVTETDGDTVYLSSNDRHHEVTYVKGAGEAVCVGLEAVSAEAVDLVAERVRSDGLTLLADQPIGKGYDKAVRFVAPGGAVFEVHTPIVRDQARRYNGVGPRPRRIEHVNAMVPDTAAFGEFVSGTLGMKLSDRTSDGAFRWYRSQDGFHHTIAMGTGPTGLHHYAFDLHCMQDLQRIADNLAGKERSLVWGPGRHGAGDNIFTYYADPHGCLIENSIEMRHIDCDLAYEAGIWDVERIDRWLNLWGDGPNARFMTAGVKFAA